MHTKKDILIRIKGQSNEEDAAVMNNYEPKSWSLNTKPKMTVKGEITNSTVAAGEFSAPFYITAKTTK